MKYDDGIKVVVADASYEKYVDVILATINDSAKKRGSGIATRTQLRRRELRLMPQLIP